MVVLDMNKEKERVSLGLKQKHRNPWDNIETKYPVGAKVKGKVVNLVPYGAFVELEPGVEGLIHVTELSWTKRIAKPSDVLKQDQEIEAVVLGINREEQKISLGVRQLESNPWDSAAEKYTAGTKVKGKVRNLTSYGAFVELEEGIDGMIHVSDMSWTRKINHPTEVMKKGDDSRSDRARSGPRRTSASRSASNSSSTDPWATSRSSTKSATSSPAKSPSSPASARSSACRHDIDGLVHISQISEERVDKIKNVLKVGQEVTARVIKIDKGERRIGLSIKAANYSPSSSKRRKSIRSRAQARRRARRPATRLRPRRGREKPVAVSPRI